MKPFRIRLLLVCAQLLIYYQRFSLTINVIRACYFYCKQNEKDLEENYRAKVGMEFVKAMNELNARMRASDANEDEDEEAMLEEMLNAEQHGYAGEFLDDYDEAHSMCSKHIIDEDSFDDDEDDVDDGALFSKRNRDSHENVEIKKKAKI